MQRGERQQVRVAGAGANQPRLARPFAVRIEQHRDSLVRNVSTCRRGVEKALPEPPPFRQAGDTVADPLAPRAGDSGEFPESRRQQGFDAGAYPPRENRCHTPGGHGDKDRIAVDDGRCNE